MQFALMVPKCSALRMYACMGGQLPDRKVIHAKKFSLESLLFSFVRNSFSLIFHALLMVKFNGSVKINHSIVFVLRCGSWYSQLRVNFLNTVKNNDSSRPIARGVRGFRRTPLVA